MKFLLAIYGNEEMWGSLSKEEFDALIAEHGAFEQEVRESGELVSVEGLSDAVNARTVRVRDGVPVVTDGPYLESKEYLASFFILDCENLERAVELAARYPAARRHGVEVWPLLEPGGTDDVTVGNQVEGLLRQLAPQVLGVLVRRHGQFDVCEDAVQEALLAAAVQWPQRGHPGQPAGLAAHRRLPAADRRLAQRPGTPAPGGDRGGHRPPASWSLRPPTTEQPDRTTTR